MKKTKISNKKVDSKQLSNENNISETLEITESTKQSNLKTLESNVETSFFYTSDKFINAFDNDEILNKI